MDANGVLAYSYDDSGPNGQLATTTVLAAASTDQSPADFDAVWDAVYDPATATVRIVFV